VRARMAVCAWHFGPNCDRRVIARPIYRSREFARERLNPLARDSVKLDGETGDGRVRDCAQDKVISSFLAESDCLCACSAKCALERATKAACL